MLSDPTIAQGYMAKNLTEGVKAAGSNSAGAMTGFMGVGMGINAMGNMMNSFAPNQQAAQQTAAGVQAGGATAGAVAAGAMAAGVAKNE